MKTVTRVAPLLLVVLGAGCTGDTGAAGANALVSVTAEEPGENCPAGGLRVDTGLDDGAGGGAAGDGVLGAGEIDATEYVCNGDPGDRGEAGEDGGDGADGADGAEALVAVTDEPAGANCAAGGERIDTGLDNGDGGETAGDGVLGPGEIDATNYVCDGADGADGQDGSDGGDGATSLIATSDEPAGANCPGGGIRIDAGLDNGDGGETAGDGILGAGEIDATSYVCDGEDGADGQDGSDGQDGATSLIATSDEPAGANCLGGGIRIDTGLDNGDGGGTAGNGVLEAGEIDATSYVCDGYSTWPSGAGILQDLSLSELETQGWSVCFLGSYGDDSLIGADVLSACPGDHLLMACRITGADTLTVAAADQRAVVAQQDAAGATAHHVANGVGWYYTPEYSWGFFPAGEALNRSSCDIETSSAESRLCWHTGAAYSEGWRCGAATNIYDASYDRLVLTK